MRKQKQLKTITHFNVYSGIEDGLLGVAADPDFDKNHWLYFYYAVAGDRNVSQLTRYALHGDTLDLTSRKVLLEIPTQRTYCCHSAGYLTFDADGLLYLSTGDNTNAEEIEGHNPTDERPGRQLSDDQGTTANSKDFRGKILRIKPLPDGTYAIPDGNLFPKDGLLGFPEIYVMGCRNPFRVSVDPKTKFVYWGDVGPDTNIPAEEGFLSYDEINQARKPGFFGYPYFLGNNEGFPKYDFETKKEGPKQDPLHPVNKSPNNTGVQELPPAQPALIWYGKGESRRWPMVGKGAASAMAGPVYYSDLYPSSKYKLPEYYNGKLFIYEWIRKWIMAVTLDQDGNYVSMEPFLPHLKVIAPMDMQIAPDGAIYMLAYGTNWFAKNTDAGLIRVEYSEGNRNPIADIQADKTVGGVPLTVNLSAGKSRDYDPGDQLGYTWQIGETKLSGQNVKHTFTKPGTYPIALTVSDQAGGSGVATTQIKVGNTPPDISISTKNNRSFYWDNAMLNYQVNVKDAEDKLPDSKNIKIAFDYLPVGKDFASVLSGASHGNLRYAATEAMYATLDCKSCHTMDTKSIGPALKAVSKRYQTQAGAREMLAEKIRKGGSGNWGSYPMPPHPDLTAGQSLDICPLYSITDRTKSTAPTAGYIEIFRARGTGGRWGLCTYCILHRSGSTGHGATQKHAPAWCSAVHWCSWKILKKARSVCLLARGIMGSSRLFLAGNGKFVSFKNVDLSQIRSITFQVQQDGAGGRLEIHQGSQDGMLLGSLEIPAGSTAGKEWKRMSAALKPSAGMQDIYLVFKNNDPEKKTAVLPGLPGF